MIVGPAADPAAEPLTRPRFERALLRRRGRAGGGRPHRMMGDRPGSNFARRATTLEWMSLFWRVVLIECRAVDRRGHRARRVRPRASARRRRRRRSRCCSSAPRSVIALNVLLLRRIFTPLARLTGTMRRVEPLDPGRRVRISKPAAEVAELARAFNDMLDRLEAERQGSARRALAAQRGRAAARRPRVARPGGPDADRRRARLGGDPPARAGRPARGRSRRSRRRRAPVSSRSARSRAACAPARWRSSGCAAR